MSLLDRFQRHLETLQLGAGKALVAVSGGPDSVTLLDLLVRSRTVHGLELVVAHVDHGIHPESTRVAERVAALALGHQLSFESGRLELGPAAGETVARAERYAWLEAARVRTGSGFIVLAHHADDQIETVLMRALRGSGPAGLAGMAARRGALVRPLLPFRRAELAEYVQAEGLQTWCDPANADTRHLRSWLRTELLPTLRARVPDADHNLLRLSAQAAADRAAWDALVDRRSGLSLRIETDGVSLAHRPLIAAGPVLAAALLRAAARKVGCHLGPARLARVEGLLESGGSGAAVPLGGRWRAELSFDRLYLVAAPRITAADLAPWMVDGNAGEQAWGRWQFHWCRDAAPSTQERHSYTAWLAPARLTVRRWAPGDAIRPLGGRGRRPVTQFLQEARVPRWRRPEWPVVIANAAMEERGDAGRIVWVPGICRSEELLPQPGGPALRLEARYG